MTRRRVTSVIGALTTLAVIALTFQFSSGGLAPIAAGASTVTFGCSGRTDDTAGTIGGSGKSSDALIKLFNPSGSVNLPIDVSVDAPAKVTKGSAPFNVTVHVNVKLDPSLAATVKTALGRTQIDIVNTSINLIADSVNQPIGGTIPNQTVDISSGAGASASFSATVNPSVPGRIHYKVVNATVGVAVNGSAGGGVAQVGTLTMVCGATGDNIVGSTQVQVPGAPNVADLRYQGHWGLNFFKLLDGQSITPDDGNPILPDTLQLTSPIPISHGLAATKDGWLAMLLGYQGYTDSVQMTVCAPARPVPAEPGANETYELKFPEFYRGHQGNAQLLGFKFALNGVVVDKLVSTSVTNNPLLASSTSGPAPWPTSTSASPLFLGDPGQVEFHRPDDAKIKAAIETVTGPNTVSVTDGVSADPTKPAPYEIQFVGSLAEKNAPDITIGKWYTTFPHETGEQIMAQATALSSSAGGPTTPIDVNALTQQLLAGQISLNTYGAKLGQALSQAIMAGILGGINIDQALATITSLFPSGPAVAQTEAARATVPATTTGPLCTPFSANVVTPAVPANVVAFFTALANGTLNQPAQVAGKTVCKARVKVRVKVRSHGRTRYVTRYVTKTVRCKKR